MQRPSGVGKEGRGNPNGREIYCANWWDDMPSVPYGKGDVRKAVGQCFDSDGWRNIKEAMWAFGSSGSHVLLSCIAQLYTLLAVLSGPKWRAMLESYRKMWRSLTR